MVIHELVARSLSSDDMGYGEPGVPQSLPVPYCIVARATHVGQTNDLDNLDDISCRYEL